MGIFLTILLTHQAIYLNCGEPNHQWINEKSINRPSDNHPACAYVQDAAND